MGFAGLATNSTCFFMKITSIFTHFPRTLWDFDMDLYKVPVMLQKR